MKFIKNFKRVYQYSYGCRKYILLYFIMSVITSLLGVVIPAISAYQLVNLTDGIWDKVIVCALFIFFVNILSSIIHFISSFSTQKFSKLVISKIQLALGREILKIQLADIDKHSNGVFIQRITGDASSISSVFIYGVFRVTSIIRDLGIFIVVFAINIWIGLFFLLFIIIFVVLQKFRVNKIDKKDKDYRDQKEKTSGFATELIRGIRDIKMLNAENTFIKSVEDSINKLNQKSYDISYISRLFNMVNDILHDLFDLLLVILIVVFIKRGIFDVAIGIVIYNYRRDLLSLVYDFNGILDYVRDFNLSCDRVFSLFGGKNLKKRSLVKFI